jgi:anti-anti-sigma factor
MEISSHNRDGRVELQLKGRLDANWADHLGDSIESAVRAGQHQIWLDFAEVNYVSSAGIRVLLKFFKQLKAANGVLRVVRPSESILSILQLSGIASLLVGEPQTASPAKALPENQQFKRNGVTFELHDRGDVSPLDGQLHGCPEHFASGRLTVAECRRIRFDSERIGLGVGAFGKDPADCSARFGEFLAVAGAAVAQPTDGSSMPDFQVTEGQLIPEVTVLHGITAGCNFRRLIRFEAGSSERGVIALAELVESALEGLGASAATFIILAESANLVGATLRQSPTLANGQSPLAFPEIRNWLSFTTERNDERSLALIVGFVEREPSNVSSPFLRHIGPGTKASGHFHAAVFPYRPLPKGNIDMRQTINSLLATESARTVMHLLADEREFEGVGQTDLMRGACWINPLRSLSPAPKT